jgi:hypothetical protein
MSEVSTPLDPWKLVWGQPYIDCQTLALAIEQDLERNHDPDFRTRLLVRDATTAIRSYWGARRYSRWLAASPAGPMIRKIINEDLGETGFPSIGSRLVASIDARQIHQIFDLIGRGIQEPVEVYIAGSIPTLISGLTARPTADIDFVDEVPAEIRRQRAVLRRIESEFGLTLGHVQSHYLPVNWQARRQWLGDFGVLRAYVLDVYDIFVSKLSSKKKKHQDDLRVLALKLDKDIARNRLLSDGRNFLDDPKSRPQIEENWRFIFQEPLVIDQATGPEHNDEPPGVKPKGTTSEGVRRKRSRPSARNDK